MLYQLYETQRSLMEPFADFAQAASKLFTSGAMFRQLPMAQRVAAGYDLLYRLGKDYEKPEFEIKTVNVDGTDVVIHEIVEIDKPFCQLRRFKRFTDDERVLETLKGQPVVLIAGGLGKGQDFSPLAPVVTRHARAVVLIGTDGPEIGRVLADTGVPCVAAQDMRDAVRRGAELAQPGDAVLLSPACASMDMFRNYPHRGAVFAEEVEDLARDRGEV